METDKKMSENEECQNLISFANVHSERFWHARKLQINFTLLFWGGLLAGVAFGYPNKNTLFVPLPIVICAGIVIFAAHAAVLLYFSIDVLADKTTFRMASLRAGRLLKINDFSDLQILEQAKSEISFGDIALIFALALGSVFIYTIGILLMISKMPIAP